MNKNIFLYGLAALVFGSCCPIGGDLPEYSGSGSQGGMQQMYTGGNQMDDNYTEISEWSKRGQWNLANIHDPSIVKAQDGYFYMYQTDATYGGVDGGEQYSGHFYCRRSKDLVNWQWMGPTMHGLPSWFESTLNTIRHNMDNAVGKEVLGNSPINFADSKKFSYWAPCVRYVPSLGVYRMYYAVGVPEGAHIREHKSYKVDGEWVPDTAWTDRGFIGLMETSTPENIDSWVDKGCVTTCYSDRGPDSLSWHSKWSTNADTKETEIADYDRCYYKYNAIDPTFIITPDGQHWLIYGSWNSGFAAMQLDPVTGLGLKPQGNPWYEEGMDNEEGYGRLVYTRKAGLRWQPSEGPEVIYHDGYYYMFVANGQLSQAYNTSVVRSENIDGPYKDITGRNFTAGGSGYVAYPTVTAPYRLGNIDPKTPTETEPGYDPEHGWVGISHCAIVYAGNNSTGATDEKDWFYCSQQRYPKDWGIINASNVIMMGGVRRIVWVDSPKNDNTKWPLVLPERYANVEGNFEYADDAKTIKITDPISESEIIGDWQHIDLIHTTDDDVSFHQDESIDITILAGSYRGKAWSFDPATSTITTKNTSNQTIKLYVYREQNWEMPAGQRKPTLVYVGLSPDGKTTYWGKKVNYITDPDTHLTKIY